MCHFKISWNGTRSSFLSWSVLNCTFLALHCTPAFNLRRDATMTYLWKDAAGDIDEWMWKRIDWSETIKISVPIIQKNWSEYVPMQKKNPSQTIIYFLRISLPLDLRTNSKWRFFKDIFFLHFFPQIFWQAISGSSREGSRLFTRAVGFEYIEYFSWKPFKRNEWK